MFIPAGVCNFVIPSYRVRSRVGWNKFLWKDLIPVKACATIIGLEKEYLALSSTFKETFGHTRAEKVKYLELYR